MAKKKGKKTLQKLIDEADEAFTHYPRRKESKALYKEALKKATRAGKRLETEYVKGKIDLIDKKWEDALTHFDEVIKLKVDFFEAWLYKGHAIDELGKHEDAIECYNKALEINPKDADAWNNKGAALGDLGRYEEAIECHNKALKINPKDADAWFNKGVALYDLSKYEEAIKCYNKALKINPKDADAWYSKGVALGDLSKHEEAIKCYDKALKINPKDADAWYNKGVALGDLSRYEEAIKCYDKALEINPKDADAWDNKGVALNSLGRYEEAIECHNKALEINPKDADTWFNKGVALNSIGRHEEALECHNKALEINPKDADAWNDKGVALDSLGRHEEAIKCYIKALEIDPIHANAWNNKGVALYDLGRYEEAIKCYNKALDINPKFEIAISNRNLVLMLLGRVDEALTEREKLVSEKMKEIEQSELPDEEKEERIILEDAKKEVIIELRDKYKTILDAKKVYENKLTKSLKPRDNPLKDNFFLVLRRWNSYTPTMITGTESNLGGGYFLYWKGKGIVIDPGFDFLDNFFNNDLVVYDIDAVIITHAHVDHCCDFESLLTLIFEYNEKNSRKKKIDVFMNLGAMKKFLGWVPIDEQEKDAKINRIYPLEKGGSYDLETYNLRLKATKAVHNEVLSKDYSVGLIIELYGEGRYTREKPLKIGYTSDTRHEEGVEEQYKGVDIIVPHLGSIDENDFKIEEQKKRNENHLMLKGVISTIHKSNAKLAIISEFGEELGEHRITIVGALNRVFRQNNMARCLTGDIGLSVSIPDLKVRCNYCEKYVNPNKILEAMDPVNKSKKSVVYYCKSCKNTYKYMERRAS